MSELLDQVDGPPVCADCFFGCPRAPGEEACDTPGCWCPDCEGRRRAIEADDREPDKLHVIANELEREARPDVRALVAERFGRPTRSRA